MLTIGPSEVNRNGERNPLVYVNPDEHGLFAEVMQGDRINHAAWMRACATHSFVGTCRRCGQPLIPRRPHDIQRGEVMCTDYEAECSNQIVGRIEPTEDGGKRRAVTGCGATVCAPNGHLAKRKKWRQHVERAHDLTASE